MEEEAGVEAMEEVGVEAMEEAMVEAGVEAMAMEEEEEAVRKPYRQEVHPVVNLLKICNHLGQSATEFDVTAVPTIIC